MRSFIPLIVPALSSVASVLVFLTPSAQAITIELDLNTLPSEQGWDYYGVPAGIAESSVFSADGTTLFQNTMGTGLYSSGSNYYRLFDVTDPDLPFTLEVRARVLQEETNVSYANSYGFFFSAGFGTEAASLAISPNRIQLGNFTTVNTTIDNQEFHNYLLKGQPGGDLQLFVDNSLIYEGSLLAGNYPSHLYIGDGTGGTNARAEVTLFRFSQSETIPTPVLLPGLIGLGMATIRKPKQEDETVV